MEIELKKVGIQYLEGESLGNIFPAYHELIDGIQMCRKRKKKEHYQYNLMYDNVFSIMGKRGTGKTSVIYTLRENLPDLTGVKGDSRMPIITPDVVAKNEGIMDWILAVVGEKIDEYGQRTEKLIRGRVFEYDSVNERLKQLEKVYRRLLEYNFSDKYSARNATSFYEVVDNSARRTKNSYQLMQEIGRFWNLYVEYLRLFNTENENPLIFFFFDDIDLAPEKVEELLTTVRTFLAHPNIIVLITADEEMFLEVVQNQLDRRIGRYQKDLRGFLHRSNAAQYDMDVMGIWDVKDGSARWTRDPLKDIARMYLGKVMPPSTRYYLTMFDNIEKKKNFICNTGENTQTLIGMLITQIDGLVWNQDDISNFLEYNGKEIGFYLYFIGDTARQIGNEVWIIKGFIDAMTRLDGGMDEQTVVNAVCGSVRRFLYSSIIANHRLAGQINDTEDFVDSLFKINYDGRHFFVDYSFLNWYMNKLKESDQASEIDYETGFQLYSLAFFVENITNIVEKKCIRERERKSHGVGYFVDFIGMCGVKKELFRKSMGTSEFLYHYGELLTDFKKLKSENNTDADILSVYMYNLSKVESTETFDKIVAEWYLKEQEWFYEIVGMLFLYYENVYHMEAKRVNASQYQPGIEGKYAYKTKISSYIEDGLNSYLLDVGVLKRASRIVTLLSEFVEEDARKMIYKSSLVEIEGFSVSKFESNTVSELLSMPRLDGLVFDSGEHSKLLQWFGGLIYFGIVTDEKDYKSLLSSESSWIRIFVRLQKEFAKYDKISRNMAILNGKRLRGYLKALSEYRNQFYAQDLQEASRTISEEDGICHQNREEVQMLVRLVEEIYIDAEGGRKYKSSAFGEDYARYMDICEKILGLIDMYVNESDDEYEQECETLSRINYAVRIYRYTQILYYSVMIAGGDDSTADERNDYYFNLYKYLKDEIILNKQGKDELRESILKSITEKRKEYIDKVLRHRDS